MKPQGEELYKILMDNGIKHRYAIVSDTIKYLDSQLTLTHTVPQQMQIHALVHYLAATPEWVASHISATDRMLLKQLANNL